LPVPRRYEAKGVRRYGFHGLSYAFLMQELERLAGSVVARGRTILTHLGSGASLAAVHEGGPVDTSMSFTPDVGGAYEHPLGRPRPRVGGLSGPNRGMTALQFSKMSRDGSGLLGMSETSPDMHDLLEREGTDVRAAEAVAVFCYQVKKCIGAFVAALGGLDTLVFAGGIGENASAVRSRICCNLECMGIALEGQRNASSEGVISAPSSRVSVRVIRTDEEWMIAKSVRLVLGLR
jgi:acetate kinase